jgi:hypothetical protein
MLRDLAAIATLLFAFAPVAGFAVKRFRRQRRSASLDHIRKLELEIKEMDEIQRRIDGE